MNAEPTSQDLNLLKAHYESAVADRDAMEWTGDSPDYPESIPALMTYVTSSAWCNQDYQPTETKEILGRLQSASLSEVCSVLTAISRSERFCTGSWKRVMEDGKMSLVVARAEELMKPEH